MRSELPDIAWLRYRDLRDFGDLIFVCQTSFYPRKGGRQLLDRETKRRKIGAHAGEIGKFKA
jgi:hypothetical protein